LPALESTWMTLQTNPPNFNFIVLCDINTLAPDCCEHCPPPMERPFKLLCAAQT
jgi:hypothetical protein